MQATASFKLTLLRGMLAGLSGVSSRNMGLLERKAAIKHAADMAMAAARGSGARWSRALLTDLSKRKAAPTGAGSRLQSRPLHGCGASSFGRKFLRRSFRERSCRAWKRRPAAPRGVASASILARRMVKKRAQVLRRLVPGADALDGFSLLEETLDYAVSLRAQVELMRGLTGALAHHSGSPAARSYQETNKDS
ncbi:hypothetical protein Taro_011163 [Colocasia esculenta]|uniref:IBH1-like N-terminal domain-containing protein n=1 Tax=Colocasia esculenta TaxID=4460 RepID=A0A843U939_COLES|nr:hypothetical protein [Colocasia esculenta]